MSEQYKNQAAQPAQFASPYFRQNDQEAQTYIKGSYYCLMRERQVKYFMICMAFFVCLCGIVNKYIPHIFSGYDAASMLTIQEKISTYINIASGAVLILNLLLGFYTQRMHREGIVLQECFDCYVFNITRNEGALRAVSQTMIDIYAARVRKKASRFMNLYYNSEEDVDPKTGHFDNLNRQFRSDQRLYMSVHSFFLTLWLGFCIVIFLLAISFNDQFVGTLINILFPSMSAITIIINSWFNFTQQLRQMTTAIAEIDRIQRMPDAERRKKMIEPFCLRCLQDALFNFRMSPFVIPSVLVRQHEKRLAKESWGNGIRKSSDLILAVNDKVTYEKEQTKTQSRIASANAETAANIEKEQKKAAPRRKSRALIPPPEVSAEVAATEIETPLDSYTRSIPRTEKTSGKKNTATAHKKDGGQS